VSGWLFAAARSHARDANSQSHTIVLVQTTASRATRTFHDYEGVGAAMDGELVLTVDLLVIE
jgi:hypothetical protein